MALYNNPYQNPYMQSYGTQTTGMRSEIIHVNGENGAVEENTALTPKSKFMQMINGKQISNMLFVVDELMSTLQVLEPRLYDGVMENLKEIE